MGQQVAAVALLVEEYDAPKQWFVEVLGFALLEDTPLGGGKRWVRVGPSGGGAALLLARAATPEQRATVGQQGGGRVWLFLHTDDCWRDFHALGGRGVHFEGAPRDEPYGTVVVFHDCLGNRWDLIQPRAARAHQEPAQP